MGATSWQIEVQDAGGRVVEGHGFLADGNMYVETTRPWSNDSRKLIVAKWSESVPFFGFYDLEEHAPLHVPVKSWIQSAECSPHGPRCALLECESLLICDLAGAAVASAAWKQVESTDHRFMRWLSSFNVLFVVGRRTRRGDEITFYNGENGAEVTRIDLRPDVMLPYDADAFRRIPRERFSLQTGVGAWSVGSLLDTWSAIEFNEAESLLRLHVYRPAGPATQDAEVAGMAGKDAWGCRVDSRWVEVPIIVD